MGRIILISVPRYDPLAEKAKHKISCRLKKDVDLIQYFELCPKYFRAKTATHKSVVAGLGKLLKNFPEHFFFFYNPASDSLANISILLDVYSVDESPSMGFVERVRTGEEQYRLRIYRTLPLSRGFGPLFKYI